MYKRHFAKFAVVLTMLFTIGILLLFVINQEDNNKTGQSKTLSERISEIAGN